MLKLDHVAIACTDLSEGTAWVEERLNVKLQPGGQHARYGTHNTLLGLADGLYLEVIAIDPEATPEAGHSWFGLDHFSGPPRLANWICQTDDLESAVAKAPPEAGSPRALTRGDLEWQITVPDDGALPFQGAFPTLIAWGQGVVHPSDQLSDSGCRLVSLSVKHPEMGRLSEMMDLADERVTLEEGAFGMRATFVTPSGLRTL
ncbi:VOC family protein [Yoonia litorea]|uniref:Glyoxalase-like domain-containing protein n=1 Tax=Yoonia litorea TaxID=1123755 RepID=A0A1I6LJ91_9RHOB|nr:VOC family protein [Yoonia litorea]SFS03408.1 Glyoxalase-like domain-containing protein [Yoonia litorea]